MAPAVMVGEEIVVERDKMAQYKVESVICRHLGLPAPKFDRKAFWDFLVAQLF